MRRSTIFLFFATLLVHNWAIDLPHFSTYENDVDFWDEGANKRSDSSHSSSSSSSSFSSSSSSSSSSTSSSDSSDSFEIKVEEHEQKTDKYGTHEITKIHEKKKPAGGNETSSSKTIEVFRYANGTIRRKVKTNGKGMQAECTKNQDCGDKKFCSKFRLQCQQCIDGSGCFSSDQCCGDKVCKLGWCKSEPKRTGLAKSPCDDDSQCNAGLFCSYSVFDGGKCEKLRKEGESCTMGMFDRRRPKCLEGLSCKRTSGFAVFFKYKCLKEGSVEDTSPAESPFDWFNNWKK